MARAVILIIALPAILLPLGCSSTSPQVDKLAREIYSTSRFDEPLPAHPFKSDGCSCWPDGDWVECCVRHDLVYWMGGTREQRERADLELRDCVTEKDHPVVAWMMYYGARAGGVWWLPTPFRWGFGWDYPESGPPGKPY